MDSRVSAILDTMPREVLERVAAGALGQGAARLDGPVDYTEIKKPHAEERTIAIVRASGSVGARQWSSVIKLVDLGIEGAERLAGMTWPENEEHVYEQGYFADEGLRFRPARCYAVTRPQDQIKLFWLEDLTGAKAPPFAVDEIAQMARHLGEWNGAHAGTLPDLNFALGRDAYVRRLRGFDFVAMLADLERLGEHELIRATFRGRSSAALRRLLGAADRLLERVKLAPHSLAFGDCTAGNLFHLPAETVAVDWASLTNDPTGVDGGCFIGSTLTWGADFMRAVEAERELFESYCEGLRAGGWRGKPDDVRRAALAQMAAYLLISVLSPVVLANGGSWVRGFLEGRFGLPQEEICLRLAALVDVLPGYADEIETLLAA